LGGFFAAAAKSDCVHDLFYGTDYHSHMGTRKAGMAVFNGERILRYIHNIENAQFRSKFETDVVKMRGLLGIGVISDSEDQPVLVRSHLGTYAIATVGAVNNQDEIVKRILAEKKVHFSEIRHGEVNTTELIASIIDREESFQAGIKAMWESIRGSCSLSILTKEGIYVARDKFGRTPVIIAEKPGAWAATMETCALPNTGFSGVRDLGPGEIVHISPDGIEPVSPALDKTQICAFLWIYYGYPASSYEGINVETVRNESGRLLAKREEARIDLVAGIPDSGIGHGLGYAAEAGIPFRRPFVKYTPTWARSFIPPNQEQRDLIARMKLIPIKDIIRGRKLLFCEDSIVRGTQLKDTIQRLYDFEAKEVHMRPACPPLLYACPYLNFSRSKSEMDLAARKAIKRLEGKQEADVSEYARFGSQKYQAMVDSIRKSLNLTSLRYQRMEDMVKAIGLPKEKLCTYCWEGR